MILSYDTKNTFLRVEVLNDLGKDQIVQNMKNNEKWYILLTISLNLCF